jgi:hypothetical protein
LEQPDPDEEAFREWWKGPDGFSQTSNDDRHAKSAWQAALAYARKKS